MQKVGYSFTSKYFNAAHNTSQGRSSKYFRQKWRFEEYSCEILLRFLQIVLYSSTTAPLVRIGLYLATIKPFAKDLNHNPLVQSLVLHGNEQLSPCGNHTFSGIPCICQCVKYIFNLYSFASCTQMNFTIYSFL
jgi:hypothetical protein